MSELLDQLKAYINSTEGQKDILELNKKAKFKQLLLNKYLGKFHMMSISERNSLLERLKSKYESDNYYYRWINKGIEPPKDLYYYLLEYGYKYGTPNEIKDAHFEYDSFIIDNAWIITCWYGQGSVCNLEKLIQ
jgi:hypothetical protein